MPSTTKLFGLVLTARAGRRPSRTRGYGLVITDVDVARARTRETRRGAMRCLRLSDKGVLRWYTDCCRTPIGNTAATPRFPVIALVHSFMANGAAGRSRDAVLGPPICRIYERSAVASLPPNAPAPPSLGVLARRASRIFGWWATGLGRPSPLFDDRTNAPRTVPRVLTPSERAAL